MIFTSEDQKNVDANAFDGKALNNINPPKPEKGQKGLLIFLYIITFSIYFWICHIGKINQLNKTQLKINESASGIEVQLQKRFDTLNKLVDTVKGHVSFNKEIFENIAKYRSHMQTSDINEKVVSLDKISSGISLAFENYPNLGADESVQKLMNEIIIIEREIAAARRLYNSEVTAFNSTIYTFPMNVIVYKKGYSALNLFKGSEQSLKDVQIKF